MITEKERREFKSLELDNDMFVEKSKEKTLNNLATTANMVKEIAKEIKILGVDVKDMLLRFKNSDSFETFFIVDDDNYKNPDLIIKAYSKAGEIKRNISDLDFDVSFSFWKFGEKYTDEEVNGAVSVKNLAY